MATQKAPDVVRICLDDVDAAPWVAGRTTMYMYAPTGLADAPGQPPQPSLSPELRTFLAQVRAHPEDFRLLLATATLHPRPMFSRFWINQSFTIGGRRYRLLDASVLWSGVSEVDILNRLRRISADFQKRDSDWQRTIEDAVKLRREYMETLSVMGRRPEALGFYPIEALLPSDRGELEAKKLTRLGESFAKEKFPPELAKRMFRRPAFEAHSYTVGSWLRRYAEVRETKDPKFKELVDKTLRKRKA